MSLHVFIALYLGLFAIGAAAHSIHLRFKRISEEPKQFNQGAKTR